MCHGCFQALECSNIAIKKVGEGMWPKIPWSCFNAIAFGRQLELGPVLDWAHHCSGGCSAELNASKISIKANFPEAPQPIFALGGSGC